MVTPEIRYFKDAEGVHFCGNRRHVTLLNKVMRGQSNVLSYLCNGYHQVGETVVPERLKILVAGIPGLMERLEIGILPDKCLVVEALRSPQKGTHTFNVYPPGSIVEKWYLRDGSHLKPGESVSVLKTEKLRSGRPFHITYRVTNKDGVPEVEDIKKAERKKFADEKREWLQAKGLTPHLIHSIFSLVTVKDSDRVMDWVEENIRIAVQGGHGDNPEGFCLEQYRQELDSQFPHLWPLDDPYEWGQGPKWMQAGILILRHLISAKKAA